MAIAACCAAAVAAHAFDYNANAAGPDFRYAGWRGPGALIYNAGWQNVLGINARNGACFRAAGLGMEFHLVEGGGVRAYKRTSCGIRGNGASEPGGGNRTDGSPPGDFGGVVHFDMGVIRGPMGAAELSDKEFNWTSMKYVFEYELEDKHPDNQTALMLYRQSELDSFAVTWSRLTPAVLLSGTVPSVLLFGDGQGNYKGRLGRGGESFKKELWRPAHFALKNDKGEISIARRSSEAHIEELDIPLEGAGKGWLLFWHGAQQTLLAHRLPVCTEVGDPRHGRPVNAYWADCPFLVVFEKAPERISAPVEEGGVRIGFGEPFGHIAVLPLFGDYYPDEKETEQWKDGLPAEVEAACDFWAKRIRAFPVKVEEIYEYDEQTDTAVIKNKFEYEAFGENSGEFFAPIPPMLVTAQKYGFPIEFSAPLSETSCLTPYGMYCGISGAQEAEWRIKDMGKYIDQIRVPGPATGGEEETFELLEREAEKTLEAGMLAPGLFATHRGAYLRDLWSGPSETMFYLSEASEFLPELKDKLLAYCGEQDEMFPADAPAVLPPNFGARREWGGASVDSAYFAERLTEVQNANRGGEGKQSGGGFESGLFEFLYNGCLPRTHYNIAAYMARGGKFDLEERWNDPENGMKNGLDYWLAHSDWASLGWFQWDRNWGTEVLTRNPSDWDYGRGGMADMNNWFAGILGHTRLAALAGDDEAEIQGRCLFAKAAALQFAARVFTRYYYDNAIFELPLGRQILRGDQKYTLGDDWHCVMFEKISNFISAGYPVREVWKEPQDDTRMPAAMNEFGIAVGDTGGAARGKGALIAMYDVTPELGRFLKDFLQPECGRYFLQMTRQQPDWFVMHNDAVYGTEESGLMPQNAHGLFMCLAWILDGAPEDLEFYADIPIMQRGDYFYMQKLCEALAARRGAQWRKWREN